MMTSLLMVNVWVFVNTLFPTWLGAAGLMMGLTMLVILLKIDEQPVAYIIGKRVGAIFGKNNLISLISLFIITVCHQLLLLKYTWL